MRLFLKQPIIKENSFQKLRLGNRNWMRKRITFRFSKEKNKEFLGQRERERESYRSRTHSRGLVFSSVEFCHRSSEWFMVSVFIWAGSLQRSGGPYLPQPGTVEWYIEVSFGNASNAAFSLRKNLYLNFENLDKC